MAVHFKPSFYDVPVRKYQRVPFGRSKLPIDRVGTDGNDSEPELNRPESPP